MEEFHFKALEDTEANILNLTKSLSVKEAKAKKEREAFILEPITHTMLRHKS